MTNKYKKGDIIEFTTSITGMPKGTQAKVLGYYTETIIYTELLKKTEYSHNEGTHLGGKPGYCWNVQENRCKLTFPPLTIEQRILNKIKYLDQKFLDRNKKKPKTIHGISDWRRVH